MSTDFLKNFVWRFFPSILLGCVALVLTAIPVFGWNALGILAAQFVVVILLVASGWRVGHRSGRQK
jgi:hypothetical protein